MESELWGNGGVVRAYGMPADFAEVAKSLGMNAARLREHYQKPRQTIYDWLYRSDSRKKKPRNVPPPVDFASRAQSMRLAALAQYYKCGRPVIVRWADELGVEIRYAVNRKLPHDFAEMAAIHTKWQLRKLYRCSDETIARWFLETGITPKKYIPIPPVNATRAKLQKKPSNRVTTARMGKVQPVFHGKQSASNYDIAADTLRRERWIVYRCNDKGLAAEKGKFWRCGTLVLTPDELLAKAARYERSAA